LDIIWSVIQQVISSSAKLTAIQRSPIWGEIKWIKQSPTFLKLQGVKEDIKFIKQHTKAPQSAPLCYLYRAKVH